MQKKLITLYQGKQDFAPADVNIIIDVLRAFTVSDYAFRQDVESIILTSDETQALALQNANTLLSGEKQGGYQISGFDYGNSPYAISQATLAGKKLVQKTTNGVAVTLAALTAKHVLVTGYSNAYATAKYVQTLKTCTTINIIASHPTGDEDLACAEYIKAILLNAYKTDEDLKTLEEAVVYRILNSKAAHKFNDQHNTDFSILDLSLSAVQTNNAFAMKVQQQHNTLITIIKGYY